MGVPTDLCRLFGAPPEEVANAYRDSAVLKEQTREAFQSVRDLCREIGVLTEETKWLWVGCGLEAGP
jgi:hypothetical protein